SRLWSVEFSPVSDPRRSCHGKRTGRHKLHDANRDQICRDQKKQCCDHLDTGRSLHRDESIAVPQRGSRTPPRSSVCGTLVACPPSLSAILNSVFSPTALTRSM